jgi:predicted RNA binding protein YcfA (HicA-like mRNA interferase family)
LLVVVPRRKEIKKGTLLSILRQAGIKREDFIAEIK